MKLSTRISRMGVREMRDLAIRCETDICRFVEFLETHHGNVGREHEGCRACALINHVELHFQDANPYTREGVK